MLQTVEGEELAISLLEKYTRIRAQSEKICKPLKIEDYVVQPVVDVSPPKWHLAHTTWFFETFILKQFYKDYQEFDPNYPFLFNSYYVTAGERWVRAQRGHLTRPTVDDIYRYRQYVDHHISELLKNDMIPFSDDNLYLFEIGLQHEQQHQELLLYDIKYILGNNPIFPAYLENEPVNNLKTEKSWLSVEEGKYTIGHQNGDFCFDNEKGVHEVFLHAFDVHDGLVTNGEYLEFMMDDGYKESTLWLSEGLDWVNNSNVKSPLYWNFLDGEWYQYSLTGLKELDLNEPVSHISFFEADAFARWKGLRLPTEFEWEIACNIFNTGDDDVNFVETENLNPINLKSAGFLSNLWEWTDSAYRPYPYYETKEGTIGEYNGKFMINQMVLRGGSYATPRDHIRPTYRNFFHPHLQWLFSGIRLARHTQ